MQSKPLTQIAGEQQNLLVCRQFSFTKTHTTCTLYAKLAKRDYNTNMYSVPCIEQLVFFEGSTQAPHTNSGLLRISHHDQPFGSKSSALAASHATTINVVSEHFTSFSTKIGFLFKVIPKLRSLTWHL